MTSSISNKSLRLVMDLMIDGIEKTELNYYWE